MRPDFTAGIDGTRTLADRSGDATSYPWPVDASVAPRFRSALIAYYELMSALSQRIVLSILCGLGIPAAAVLGLFDPSPLPAGTWSNADIKMFNYYKVGADGDDDLVAQVELLILLSSPN